MAASWFMAISRLSLGLSSGNGYRRWPPRRGTKGPSGEGRDSKRASGPERAPWSLDAKKLLFFPNGPLCELFADVGGVSRLARRRPGSPETGTFGPARGTVRYRESRSYECLAAKAGVNHVRTSLRGHQGRR